MAFSRSTHAAAGLLLAALTACGGASPADEADDAGVAQGPSASPSHGHAPSPAPSGAGGASAAASPAVQLRSDLQMLLGEHVRLAVLLMRDRVGGHAERAAATVQGVDRNTDELRTAVAGLFGDPAGTAFAQLWTAHVKQLQDYAGALADGDRAAQEQARQRLRTTETDLGALLSSAVGGRLPAAAASQVVQAHVDGLLGQADAYAAGDTTAAYARSREGFAHMLMVADTLAEAAAAATGLATDELRAPRRQLQSALARLLSEHMGLLVEAMRAAADRSDELTAAGASLNANSADLAAAVSALYGPPAGQQFLGLWADHVDGLVSYAEALGGDDAGARDRARGTLDDFATALASFLATATAQRLPAIELTAALTEHDDALVQQADAYADGDFAGAQERSAEGYRHMFALAQTLADAIGDEVAAGLPQGGAQTGGGGSAPG